MHLGLLSVSDTAKVSYKHLERSETRGAVQPIASFDIQDVRPGKRINLCSSQLLAACMIILSAFSVLYRYSLQEATKGPREQVVYLPLIYAGQSMLLQHPAYTQNDDSSPLLLASLPI